MNDCCLSYPVGAIFLLQQPGWTKTPRSLCPVWVKCSSMRRSDCLTPLLNTTHPPWFLVSPGTEQSNAHFPPEARSTKIWLWQTVPVSLLFVHCSDHAGLLVLSADQLFPSQAPLHFSVPRTTALTSSSPGGCLLILQKSVWPFCLKWVTPLHAPTAFCNPHMLLVLQPFTMFVI